MMFLVEGVTAAVVVFQGCEQLQVQRDAGSQFDPSVIK